MDLRGCLTHLRRGTDVGRSGNQWVEEKTHGGKCGSAWVIEGVEGLIGICLGVPRGKLRLLVAFPPFAIIMRFCRF